MVHIVSFWNGGQFGTHNFFCPIGRLNAVKSLQLYLVYHSYLVIGWDPPEAVLVPNWGHRYCINILTDFSNKTHCNVRVTEFRIEASYALDYEVVVRATNRFGLGAPASLAIREPSEL